MRDIHQNIKVEGVETKLSCETSIKISKWKMWKRSFRARHPSKSQSGRCENEAFVRDIHQNLNLEDVKTKPLCETSIKISKWKVWKRSSRARHPSKSQSGRCGNEALVRDIHQNLKVEDVETKLSCETSIKISKRKMWKRSFRARHPSKSQSGRCGNKAFVRDIHQNLKTEDVETKLLCETSTKISKRKMWKRSFRARHPSKSQSGRCENEAFVRDIHQNLKVEDVENKLSCKTSIKISKWKMWKRSFCARHPSKSQSGRCGNEAFVRDIHQNLKERHGNEAFVRDIHQNIKVEDVETKLSCKTSIKISKWKMWKRSFCARHPPKSQNGRCGNEALVRDIHQNLKVEDVETKLSCETSIKISKRKMWKRSFRARHPSKSQSGKCENEAFVRDIHQNLNVEDVETKPLCETSIKISKWKTWKRSFRARHPSKSQSGRCGNEAFVRDIHQNLKTEDVETKLSCETSIKISKWKMWKRSFRARHPSKSQNGRCGNEAFVRDIHQNLKVEDVETKPLCETSIKISKWKMLKQSFCARHPSKSQSGRCGNEALVRDIHQNLKVEDVETKLLWENSLDSRSSRCENAARVRDFSHCLEFHCFDILGSRNFRSTGVLF